MARKILIIIATIFFIVSCNKNSNGTNNNIQKYDDLTNIEKLSLAEEASFDEESSFDDEELSFKPDLTGLDKLRGTYDAVINTDCDYYDNHGNLVGRFSRGQGIAIKEGFYAGEGYSVFVETQTADSGVKGYVREKYITNFNGVNYGFWFKNILMTRSYYYTEPVEYIYNEEIEKEIDKISWDKKSLLEIWRAFYSESRLRFTENHLVMGTDEGIWAFRLGEIINKSVAKDNTTYIIQLIDYPKGKLEITLIDNGNSVTITQSIIKEKRSVDMGYFLLYTYIPYNKKKSEKTAKAVHAWCTEQIGKL
jgi:hypothetical protein